MPNAEVLLLGMTDGYSNIHALDERVLIDEFETAVLAETESFGAFAERGHRPLRTLERSNPRRTVP